MKGTLLNLVDRDRQTWSRGKTGNRVEETALVALGRPH